MRAVAILVFLLLLVAEANAEAVYVGVLEESQSTQGISARILFFKRGNDWLSVADGSYGDAPEQASILELIKWTVTFDGHSLGQLKIKDPEPGKKFINPWFYARDKLFDVPAHQEIPKVPDKSKQFAGWMKVPQYRPLVLVSRPDFKDPEHWKPFVPDAILKSRLYVSLRLVVGRFNLVRCPGGPYVNEPAPYDFKPDDIVVYRAYHSLTGKRLVAIGLDSKKYGCDGPRPAEWADNWFLLEGDNIDFMGRQMSFVDVGDYDNDGRSEMLFWHSGYNEDGYVFLYDSLRRKREYFWNYH